ncbi:MAG: 2,3-bisphosphoglycerate-independent phosphoglycerate mutase [Megasphaera sp.]|jgi:2,3-bisphosphoglycerate-independent phosphoglycerate mutase|nr:2,3-bisphosphoglycerate-independent phosphoglycerate mutase [Megasphaera sp.]MCH4218135.1 2,3-bisphosphoglycerate-independent phosphoglycerate mutase [Megasphaera sp.]
MNNKKPVMLVIMDGFGCSDDARSNAVAQADLKVLPKLWNEYPHSHLGASGEDVGLPDGQIGNSEVGHLNIGAGRIIYQDLTKITKDIEDGAFFKKPVLMEAMENAKAKGSALHLLGLVSPGGVHSSEKHLYGLLKMAKQYGLQKVYVHAFLDGRDVLPRSASAFLQELEDTFVQYGVGEIATISGRYYAMDRDKRWDRVEKAYRAVALGEGPVEPSAQECLKHSYADDISDEFVIPTVIHKHPVEDGDSVIFFNFRPDRARQLTEAFVTDGFKEFNRPKKLDLYFATMTRYESSLPVHVVYDKERIPDTLGEVLAKAGKTQLRIAETEKYAHVTYFFNGGEETPNKGEDRILVPSPKVATYDLQPEMSAPIVTEKVIAQIEAQKYDMIMLNFANADMVGHTGILKAAIKAVETVDTCVGKIVEALKKVDGQLLIIADHGNAEKMTDLETGSPYTAHTTNHVPCIMVSEQHKNAVLQDGILADVAPTLLYLAGMDIPADMTGKVLVK